MRNLLILSASIVLMISCSNQDRKELDKTEIMLDSIAIMPDWGDNNLINLELKKTKTIKRNGVSQTGSSTSDIELKISKTDKNTWNCKWKIKDVQSPAMNNPLEKKMENLVKGFMYDFILDSTGTFVGLKNWEEIQAKGIEALNLIINELKKQPTMNEQILTQIKMNVGEMFNTKEKIETYLMQEVQLYFALSGIELNRKDTIEGIVYTAHPLTGDLIEQTLKTIYQKAYSDSTCDVQIIQSVDESDLYNAVENTVNKVAGEEKTNEFMQEMQNIKFDLKITNDYNVSLKTGLVEKVISEKNINVGNDQRIDRIEITKI